MTPYSPIEKLERFHLFLLLDDLSIVLLDRRIEGSDFFLEFYLVISCLVCIARDRSNTSANGLDLSGVFRDEIGRGRVMNG